MLKKETEWAEGQMGRVQGKQETHRVKQRQTVGERQTNREKVEAKDGKEEYRRWGKLMCANSRKRSPKLPLHTLDVSFGPSSSFSRGNRWRMVSSIAW